MSQNLKDPRVVEIWVLFAIGTSITFIRLYSRGSLLGIRGLQADDYFAVIAVLFWSAMCFCDTTIRTRGIELNPLLLKELGIAIVTSQPLSHASLMEAGVTDSQISLLSYILQLNWVSWLLKPPMLWSLKASMVIFFLRLTNNLPWMRKATMATAAFILVTFLAAEGTILLMCVPAKNNWDVYDMRWRTCSSFSSRTQIINYVVVGVSNILTDILLILLPIPMLWQVRIPLPRKLGTGFLLCSGVFIIVIALIRTVLGIMSYKAKGIRSTELRDISFAWGMRENFTAFVVVNAIAIRPFFSSAPWKSLYSRLTGSKLSTSGSAPSNPSADSKPTTGARTANSGYGSRASSSKRHLPSHYQDTIDLDDGIMVKTTFTVKSEVDQDEKEGVYPVVISGQGGGQHDGRNWPMGSAV